MPPSSDPRINQLRTTIESERRNLEGAKAVMRAVEASSKNEAVIQQAQNEVRAAQASIRFLEDELQRLQLSANAGPSSSAAANNGQTPHGAAASPSSARRPVPGAGGPTQPLNPNRGGEVAAVPNVKPYTQLDLLRYDAPLSGYKITHMLNQLGAKLLLEEAYKTGIEKMANAYRMEGDRRLRSETDAKRIESDGKITLLRKAKRRYEKLAEFGAVDEVEDEMPDFKRKEALRKPISGRLQITLKAARDLNHRTLSRRSSRVVETMVVVKVEGTMAWKSMMSRNDRWYENIEIPVTKANEVEITIYDNIGGEESAPIGMLWLRVSDLMEALRRQKVAREAASDKDWVTADKAATIGGRQGAAPESATLHQNAPRTASGTATADAGGDGIDGWWSVEPAGALNMRLDFIKDSAGGGRRPYEALGRQGAVKKRKGDVHEMNGHKFVQRQFYQPIMCALCRELLLTGEGYQCEDCRYACHKKCYPKVVTKCISKPATDGEGDEEKINHRIPHRFQPYTNITANWCSHCGYMLPFGRKNAYKCSECALTCHQSCAHLIPDFCGMTMEMANTLLKNLREIGDRNKGKPIRPGHAHSPSASYSPAPAIVAPPKSEAPYTPSAPAIYQPKPDVAGKQLPTPPTQQQPPTQQLRPQPPTTSARPSVDGRPSYENRPSYDQRPSFDGRPDIANVSTGPIGTPQKPPAPQQPPAQLPAIYQPPAPTPPKQPSGYRPPAPAPIPVSQPPTTAPQVAYNKPAAPPAQPPQQQVAARKKRIGLDDFNFLAVLGKGNFGKVMLAEERQTTNLYAIKVLKKEFIIENDEVESTQSEKRVFLAAAEERHPFLLGLHSCFQTETRVYFVMEYVSGGDLMLHIQRRQFTLRQAKFYACEVLLALEYFHSRGIIYRDLKLDNILLTLDGHVKVADYGLCKEGMHYGKTTSTFCGTPEFMAPEILQEQPYGRAVDWWAFGVLTYEMLLGQSPFRGDDEDEIFDAIIEDEPLYPITMPRDAVSLLQKLLTRDPQRRLGAGPDDAMEIKRHQFFSDVNFDDVYHKRIPPPYFPTIGNATDTSNFDKEFTREQPTLTPVHTQLTAQDQAEFAGFSWIAPWAAA